MHLRHLLPLAALLLPLRLPAQSVADTGSIPDSGRIIRGVQLQRRDIFDPNEQSWFARLANSLHVRTRPAVIRKELLFRTGEVYDSASVAESERNLRAMGIFRRVQIDTIRTPQGLMLRVETKDGWSTQLDWRFRSTGGQVAFTIGLVENNLLGTASSAALRYRKDPDRSSVTLGFRRPRVFAGTIGLAVAYENRSDGSVAALAVDQPFFALTSKKAFRFEAENRHERVLQFRDGLDVASDTVSRRFTLVRGAGAWAINASTAGYLRAGVAAQVRRDDFQPESSTEPFPKSVTAAIGPYLVWNRARFLVTRGYAGFAREEDVDIGTTLLGGLGIAPKAFGYERNGLGPVFRGRVGAKIPGGFAYLEALGERSLQLRGARLRHGPGRRHRCLPIRIPPCRRCPCRGRLAREPGPG